MRPSFRLTRLVPSLLVVTLLGAAFYATNIIGQTSSACRALNRAEARLTNADGAAVGRVVFGVHPSCKTKVTANLTNVSDGFHGFHIHTTGTCDPEATDASENPSPFFTAGAHWNLASTDHGSHTGDLPPVLGMDTGAAFLRVLTHRFQVRDLFDEDGSAVTVHAGSDNLANIPAETSTGGERYHSHQYNTRGADEDSRKTGDAGARYACGVVERIRR